MKTDIEKKKSSVYSIAFIEHHRKQGVLGVILHRTA